jgi:hypothetical protein
MAFSGEFPDPSLDPEMRMRICIRDAELIAPTGDWRISFPGGMMTRNFKNQRRGFADLLSGFQTLSAIPDCHWVGLVGGGDTDSHTDTNGFPYNGAFCSCICGQEQTSWSWALPTASKGGRGNSSSQLPTRIMLPGRVLGNGGTVTERAWKYSSENDQLVYLSSSEYGQLLETKLRVAEQKVQIDQLREQYNSVMEEMTKRNIFLKEKWAEEAVQVGSKETVVDILSQKIGALERLVRELTDAKEMAERCATQLRNVSANELASARKELLEDTQKLKYKIADTAVVEASLFDQLQLRDKEIDSLKKEREFLLGIGVKSMISFGCQKDEFPDDESAVG